MKFLDLFRKKGTEGRFYPLNNTPFDVKEMTRTDYIKLYTGWQYLAVSTIANSFADIDFILSRNKNIDKDFDHPYKELITYDLKIKIATSLLLTGTCVLYKNKIGNKIDSLDFLRTDLVTIEEDYDGSPKSFRYSSGNKNYLLSPDDVIYFSFINPLETYPHLLKGVSPMQAVAIQAEMDMTANRWNWTFFKQGATVGGTLSTPNQISIENKQQLVSDWRNKFEGINNSSKIAVLDNGLTYTPFNVSKRELDFVESRRFTRDEVLAIFKVPKEIVGITENSNRATAMVAEKTFYKICISPLCKQVADTLNQSLFNGIGFIKYINIIPSDSEQLLLDFNSGAITINEYRIARGYEPIQGGDELKYGIEASPVEEEVNDEVKQILSKNFKGTREWKEKIWREKVARTNTYEEKWIKEINDMFDIQLRDITSQIQKGITKSVKWDKVKYKTLWTMLFTPLFKDVMRSEGNESLSMLGIQSVFQVGNPRANKFLKKNIDKLAKEVDTFTKEQVFDIIESGNNAGLGAVEISKNVSDKFQDFKRDRSLMIARTEITRASNEASEEAYIQSGVVEEKEYLAELDDKTSEICQHMDGKTFKLGEPIMEKGQTIAGYTNNYETAMHPPLHPNCRSTLIPVIK